MRGAGVRTGNERRDGRRRVAPGGVLSALALGLAALLLGAPAAAASTSGVVISELRLRGVTGSDEYVELVNAGAATIDISGWRLQGCSADRGTAATRVVVPGRTMLPAGGHYLFTSRRYRGPVAGDATYGTGIADSGARVLDADGAVVDGVGSPTV